MRKVYFLIIITILFAFQGCKKVDKATLTNSTLKNEVTLKQQEQKTENNANNSIETPDESNKNEVIETDETMKERDGYYRLRIPTFLKNTEVKLCSLAKEYIITSYDDFSKKYTAEDLWEVGVFNELLFTKYTKGPIIADISIGDSKDKVNKRFGSPQFGTYSTFDPDANDYNRFLLLGYKTREYYFAFQINVESEAVESVCIRKRYELPEDKADILKVLVKCNGWYGDSTELDKQRDYFNEDTVEYTQLGRGSMSMISKYGFICTSGPYSFDNYCIYRDFEGDVPKLPMYIDEYFDSTEKINPVYISDKDYPELLIMNIYTYLAKQEDFIKNNKGVLSSNGDILAYSVDGNILDLTRSSGLYETANVVIHWMNEEKPDRQLYFGHYSTIVGYINDRYLVESNLLDFNIYDVEKDEIIYSEEDIVTGRDDFSIDLENQEILDSNNNIWYRYIIDSDGNLKIVRLLEY